MSNSFEIIFCNIKCAITCTFNFAHNCRFNLLLLRYYYSKMNVYTFDKNTINRPNPGTNHDSCGSRQPQAARARDGQH